VVRLCGARACYSVTTGRGTGLAGRCVGASKMLKALADRRYRPPRQEASGRRAFNLAGTSSAYSQYRVYGQDSIRRYRLHGQFLSYVAEIIELCTYRVYGQGSPRGYRAYGQELPCLRGGFWPKLLKSLTPATTVFTGRIWAKLPCLRAGITVPTGRKLPCLRAGFTVFMGRVWSRKASDFSRLGSGYKYRYVVVVNNNNMLLLFFSFSNEGEQ